MPRRAVAFLLAFLPLVACDRREVAPSDGRVRLVATTPMVADVARAVGGERVAVTTLVGPGVDPHLFRPTREAVAEIVAADLVVVNGLHLEGKLGAALGRVEAAGRPVVAVAEAVPEERRLGDEGAHDPHVWMDASLWALTAAPVAEALAKVDPANAEAYRERAKAFEAAAIALDAELEAELARIPADRRTLVTAHDAFGYLGRRHAIEVIGVQGLSTGSEAGLRDLEQTIATIVERRIPAVFVETTVSPRTVEAIVAGAKARGHAVRIGGTLYSDSTGPVGSGAETWEGMLRANVRAMVEGLAKKGAPGE
jgi:manganese/zinc/iron transport system substrate-binding protein